MSLLENLSTFAIISILAAMLAFSINHTIRTARLWIWGAYGLHERRLEAALQDKDQHFLAETSRSTTPWTIRP